MRYEINPEYPDEIPEIEARIQGVRGAARGLIASILRDALEAGQKVAEAEAPRGPILDRNDGGRISDAIQIREIQMARGGAGGGTWYEGSLYADSMISPHLKFVMEGTMDEGEGKITPAKGNIGGVLPIQKEGEEVKFRKWVHGQKPQTEWWTRAHETVEAVIQEGLAGMNIR